ncbi:MAG: chromosome segregation protein SMC [Nitrospira sp.]|nr:chromosome segregation protein SMC [Nitrospira sp.]
MRIERIELSGFKSFAERTTFHFHPGITCIVGPNGCGKSNIVDAFRWVLGEQSAKSLRGERMEEVIFNGSTSKKPRGLAEVTMTVSGLNGSRQSTDDNGDGAEDTASVTRRLYRSGESEYILNKNICRLKDVKDLFLDTGLEVKSYFILEQERISEMVSSKPQEKRFLIEEIAGVMKYNVRKREAQSKLESSRANLQRIDDIVSEVKKQVNLLDRLARKAEKYKKLTSEIYQIELRLAKRDYQDLEASLKEILSEHTSLREEESLKRAELSRKENQIETKRLELLEKEGALEGLQTNLQNLEREIAELEKHTAISRTDRDNLSEYLAKLYQQDEEYNEKKTGALSRLVELTSSEGKLISDLGEQGAMLEVKGDLLRSLEEEIAEKEKLLEEKRRDLFKISEALSTLRNDLNKLQSSFEELKRREGSSLEDEKHLVRLLSDIENSLKGTEQTILDKNGELKLLSEKRDIMINELSDRRKRIDQIKGSLSGLKEELASYISRLDSLKEIVFDMPTRSLLTEGSEIPLLASISDILEIEAEYEKAIESALSEKANLFVLPSFKDIERAIAAVKEKGLGRTAFIPVNPLSPPFTKGGQGGFSEDVPEGVLGRASHFVKTTEEFSGIVRSLFDNIFVVKDIGTAITLLAKGYRVYFVTLDGEVVEPSGAIIGGEIRGIFRRRREIRWLEHTIEGKKGTVNHLEHERTSIQELIEGVEGDLKNTESACVDIEKDISLLRLTAENYREEKERTERKRAYLMTEIEGIINERELTKGLLTEKDAEVRSAGSEKEDIERDTASLQEEITEKRARIENLRTEVTDLRLSLASLREKVESAAKEKETVEKRIEEINRRKGLLSEEISSVQSRILQREAEIDTYREKIVLLVSSADILRDDISGRKELVETEHQRIIVEGEQVKLLRGDIESLASRIRDVDIRRTECKLKLENLRENTMHNYGTDLASIEVESVRPEDEFRLIELREEVQQLGPVNLGTLEEYEELRTRYEFLKKQREDLKKSIAELEEAISRVNSTTRKRLREAFEALKVKFSEVFSVLFGGGRADLVLTDEENILETGVEIIAQPPGKRLQNISLLSGGEKALTVLSLLFASFLIKPTPLCILDEADAPLDESNTERFVRMLRELSRDIQFIVVTHNRTTMGMADYLYGVTMEEAGVSKVISMQLIEA